MTSRVLDRLQDVEDLPTLPTVAIEVISLCQSPDVNINELSQMIHADPSLSAKILKVGNSPFYRQSDHHIDTIQRAILVLGLNEIINIVTSISVLSTFIGKKDKLQFQREAFWVHCVATAIIARHVAKKLGMRTQGRDFVGGLLHDIGKIILDEYFHDQFIEAYNTSIDEHCALHLTEQRIIGTTHMEAGGFLAEKWNLPPYLIDVIVWHHEPTNARFKDITALISVADLLSKAKQLSYGGDSMSFILSDQEGWGMLKRNGYPMAKIDLEALTLEMDSVADEVQSYIGIVTDLQESNEES
jgi:putative nucleotidyltransferase with HDIG domain